MALYPKAVLKLIPPGPNDPRITATQAILHVAVSEGASLYHYFDGPSGGVESHFYVRRDGVVEQYRDTAFEADANWKANPRAVSIETQGMGPGEWTPEQLKSIKALLLWLHREEKIPLRRCRTWLSAGVGYHSQFPEWSPVAKSCPGPARIKQFETVLVPWMVDQNRLKLMRVVVHNLWRENTRIEETIAKALAEKPVVAGFNESKDFIDELSNVPGYQAIVPEPSNANLRENVILVRDDVKIIESGFEKMCSAVPAHPGRGATWVAYRYAGQKFAFVVSHWNAGVEGKGGIPKSLPRVAQYVVHMTNMVKLVRRLRRAGYKVIVGGDTNWHWRPIAWPYAPINVFSLLRMRATFANVKTAPAGGTMDGSRRKIDCLFFRRRDVHVYSQRLIKTPSDHHVLEVVLRVVTA